MKKGFDEVYKVLAGVDPIILYLRAAPSYSTEYLLPL